MVKKRNPRSFLSERLRGWVGGGGCCGVGSGIENVDDALFFELDDQQTNVVGVGQIRISLYENSFPKNVS